MIMHLNYLVTVHYLNFLADFFILKLIHYILMMGLKHYSGLFQVHCLVQMDYSSYYIKEIGLVF